MKLFLPSRRTLLATPALLLSRGLITAGLGAAAATAAIEAAQAANEKISGFPNASGNMVAADTITGLRSSANVNFSQGQVRGPLPFFGLSDSWVRPSGATFSTHLNFGREIVNGYQINELTADAGGTGYVPGDTITLTGGTGTPGIIIVDIVGDAGDVENAHVSFSGNYSIVPSNPVGQASSSGSGTGATFTLTFSKLSTLTDNANGLPLVLQGGADIMGFPSPNCPTCALKTIGAPPWTITAAVAYFCNLNTGNKTLLGSIPIMLCDTANDKALALTWWRDYTYAAAYDSLSVKLGSLSSRIADPQNQGFLFEDYFAWFRVINDGATISFETSVDGLLFMLIWQEAVGYLSTIDKVGFGFDRVNTAGSPIEPYRDQAVLLWRWVES
jgi:hypothetical protein